MKLRVAINQSAFVGFIAVKTPTAQLSRRLKAPRLKLSPLLTTPRAARQLLQVVTHYLVEAFTHFVRSLTGTMGYFSSTEMVMFMTLLHRLVCPCYEHAIYVVKSIPIQRWLVQPCCWPVSVWRRCLSMRWKLF